MTCKRNGLFVVDMQPYDSDEIVPVRLTSTDLFHCGGCGSQVVCGAGKPILDAVNRSDTPKLIISHIHQAAAYNDPFCYVYQRDTDRHTAEEIKALGLPPQWPGPGEVRTSS